MIDIVSLQVKAGDGGDGACHFLRLKYMPKGGPDGGDGGDGGAVYAKVAPHENTLRHLSGVKAVRGESGKPGTGFNCSGEKGKEETIFLPMGTVIWQGETWEEKQWLAELTQADQVVLLARPGRGGRGNQHFKSSTNQTPLEYERGGRGEKKTLWLELKLQADVGLVGLPNVGKSTLLSVLTSASPKIANYPFTTLEPNLGVMSGPEYSYVVADIPGLIEKASEGKGLGHQFLRHVERCRMLLFVLNPEDYILATPKPNSADLAEFLAAQFSLLLNEITAYDPTLVERTMHITINKCDIIDETIKKTLSKDLSQLLNQRETPIFLISAATKENLTELTSDVHQAMLAIPPVSLVPESYEGELPIYRLPEEDITRPVLKRRSTMPV